METVIILLSVVLGASYGGQLPSDWKTCKGSKELSNCLKFAIEDTFPKLKNGVSKLGIVPLEPLNIPSATIGEGTGPVHVVQSYKNFEVFGISTAKFQELNATLTSNGFTLEGVTFIPEVKIVADYNFNGRVLLLPIVGNGKCQIILRDLQSKIKLVFEKIYKKGVEYLKLASHSIQLNPGKAIYNFENLFNGDPRLGAEINKLLNDNWKVVFDDVKSGYEKVYDIIVADYANKVFAKIPFNEIL